MNAGQYDIRTPGAQLGVNTYVDSAGCAPKQVGLVEGIDSELSVALKQIHELHAMAKSIGDRVFGTQPEAVRNGAKEGPNQLSQAGRLEATTGYIRESLRELGQQLSRFERL